MEWNELRSVTARLHQQTWEFFWLNRWSGIYLQCSKGLVRICMMKYISTYSLSIRNAFIALLKDLGVTLSWMFEGTAFQSLGPAYVICLADCASLLYEVVNWFLLFCLKFADRLGGSRLFCSFHMKLACLSCKVSSKGRMDNCLKRGSGSSSWDLKVIILMAFLVLAQIFSMLASGAVPPI